MSTRFATLAAVLCLAVPIGAEHEPFLHQALSPPTRLRVRGLAEATEPQGSAALAGQALSRGWSHRTRRRSRARADENDRSFRLVAVAVAGRADAAALARRPGRPSARSGTARWRPRDDRTPQARSGCDRSEVATGGWRGGDCIRPAAREANGHRASSRALPRTVPPRKGTAFAGEVVSLDLFPTSVDNGFRVEGEGHRLGLIRRRRRATPQVGRHRIRRVAVEVVPRAVVGPRRAGVGMSHGVLDVLQGTPAPSSSVANEWRRLWGLILSARGCRRGGRGGG